MLNIKNASEEFRITYNLIVNHKFQDAYNYVLDIYKSKPDDTNLIHLIVSSSILLKKNETLLSFLRYEESLSLYSYKLSFIRKLMSTKNNNSLFYIGENLLKKGWKTDAEIYFNIHALFAPNHDKTNLLLGENAIRNNEFQKGLAFFNNAAKNYLKI